MTSNELQSGAFRKGTAPERRHRPVEESGFPPEHTEDKDYRDDAFKKETVPDAPPPPA